MEDILNSIKATLYERATSPLFGTFAFSFFIWNYKLILVLIAPIDVLEKFDYIEKILYPTWWSISLKLFFGPAISALLIIFLYPIPAKFVYRHWLKNAKELKDLKKQSSEQELLTRGEAKKLRQDIAKIEVLYDEELKNKDQEISDLKALIAENQKLVETVEPSDHQNPLSMADGEFIERFGKHLGLSLEEQLKSDNNSGSSRKLADHPIPDRNDKNLIQILKEIIDADGSIYYNTLRNNIDFSPIELDVLLEELADNGITNSLYEQENSGEVSLTPKGKKLCVQWKLVPQNVRKT